jgi:RNA polymerase sigma-70 factor (ECF subfamily)
MEAAVSTHDQALIDECLAGRIDAFGELIAPYQDRLFNTLYRVLGHQEDAAEVWQETMIRAFRALGSFHGHASFYTWLYRIAMNEALTRRRRERSIARQPSTNERMIDSLAGGEGGRPSRELERKEQRQVLEQALASLDETYRSVLVLKDIEGLKYEEIAEILAIPLGTVRSRLHRGRSELRDRLRPLLERGVI